LVLTGVTLAMVWPQQLPAGIIPAQPHDLAVPDPQEHDPVGQPQLHCADPVSAVTPRDGVS
jgi:hypothetical protein